MEFNLDKLIRPNIRTLKPYSSARSEFSGKASIFLDANENSFGSPSTKWYNRYPDPLQKDIKKKLAAIKKVAEDLILLGNGSDECIDLILRAFCEPGRDNIVICPPTYGMYEVYAHINNVEVKEVPLTKAFQLDMDGLQEAVTETTSAIFICSPNNPTGNSIDPALIEVLLNNFEGLVIVDEAYINFSKQRSLISWLKDYPNLVVMQTLSKAWGLASLRLGMLFASKEIVQVLNSIKPPYNINGATQEIVLKALDNLVQVNDMIRETVGERERLGGMLEELPLIETVFPSDANFLLVRMQGATAVYDYLKEKGIIVRNRSSVQGCENCLRITVGTPEENDILIQTLKDYTK